MRYLITFSYDGSKHMGYQKQKEAHTVQKELEDALKKINSNKDVSVVASGRTDRGVHALGQTAHFDLDKNISEKDLKNKLNKILSSSIYISNVQLVSDKFHARFDVEEKQYEYLINMGEYNPLEVDYVLQYNRGLNIQAMQKASSYLIGRHDFSSFVKKTDLKPDNVRDLRDVIFTLKGSILHIEFRGSGFLRYMVRNMVGTLIEVGNAKIVPDDVKKILSSKDRTVAYKTAPACGLYLKDVIYFERF